MFVNRFACCLHVCIRCLFSQSIVWHFHLQLFHTSPVCLTTPTPFLCSIFQYYLYCCLMAMLGAMVFIQTCFSVKALLLTLAVVVYLTLFLYIYAPASKCLIRLVYNQTMWVRRFVFYNRIVPHLWGAFSFCPDNFLWFLWLTFMEKSITKQFQSKIIKLRELVCS